MPLKNRVFEVSEWPRLVPYYASTITTAVKATDMKTSLSDLPFAQDA